MHHGLKLSPTTASLGSAHGAFSLFLLLEEALDPLEPSDVLALLLIEHKGMDVPATDRRAGHQRGERGRSTPPIQSTRAHPLGSRVALTARGPR